MRNRRLKQLLCRSLCAMAFLVACPTTGMAQNDDISQRNFVVKVKEKGKETSQPVKYVYGFKNRREAENYAKQANVAYNRSLDVNNSLKVFEDALAKMKKNVKESSSGVFTTGNMLDGTFVVVFTYENMEMNYAVVEVTHSKTDYNVTIQSTTHTIKNVDVTGKYKKKGITLGQEPSLDDGANVTFTISGSIPEGYVTDDSRLLVQPVALDCTNEDTVAYLLPAVYEGAKYHSLQTRRKDFDYQRADSVGRFYHGDEVLQAKQPFSFSYQTRFKKPDKEKTYKGAFRVVLEDYHHILYDNDWQGTGSCLAFRPFKLLDFNMAAAELPLSSEFQMTPEDNLQTVPRDLKLKFVQGKDDQLTDDSLNQVEYDKLVKDLRQYGDKLMRVYIQGTSSPEGGIKKNTELANGRAEYASRMLKRSVSAGITVRPAVVHTWKDVVEAMEKRGNEEETAMVRNIVEGNAENQIYGLLKALPIFETVINPILESQRIMKCEYIYETEHILDAEEVVRVYYENKAAYLKNMKEKGRMKTLSEGDWYNLFSGIQDSTELDTVTMLAYYNQKTHPAYLVNKLDPYAANRMAMLCIRKGAPDLNILRPFIDLKDFRLNRHDLTNKIRVWNRPEHLINQAIMYFQEGHTDTARAIIQNLPVTPATEKVRNYITFNDTYLANLNGTLPENLKAEAEKAELYVLNASTENRAILYTELHGQTGRTRQECEALIDQLADDNAKKWYLKGIIWSGEAGREGMSDEEAADIDLTSSSGKTIPHFLAYFQHSFDLQPKYKRFYFNEGNVDDETRKKYPYRKKDIPAYRELFTQLIKQRDAAKAAEKAAEEELSESSENSESSESSETTSPQETPEN